MRSPTFDSRRGSAGVGRDGRPPIVERLIRPFEEFAAIEASGGLVLLAGMVVSLALANSPWAGAFAAFWKTELGLSPSWLGLSRPLIFWVNDGLMTVFFLVMGLEIKSQLLVGQLASPRRAALPLVAAAGGMLVPALLYLSLNHGSVAARGWGIPTATDIAFTIGVMALLGTRAPLGLKVFVTALAIADDIGAVLVIALFYSHSLAWQQLAAAGVVLALLVLANRLGVRSPWLYGLVGFGLWVCLLESGIHTTIAGVLLAVFVPARTRIDAIEFLTRSRSILTRFARASRHADGPLANPDQLEALHHLEAACEKAATPLQRMEHHLHPWVTFGIMPLFALANAGLSFSELASGVGSPRVAIGVALGLLVGKPVGILLFSWLAVQFGLAARPDSVTWQQILGAGLLCGIGFTMSIFIASLAFVEPGALASAKLGILLASVSAGLFGALALSRGPT